MRLWLVFAIDFCFPCHFFFMFLLLLVLPSFNAGFCLLSVMVSPFILSFRTFIYLYACLYMYLSYNVYVFAISQKISHLQLPAQQWNRMSSITDRCCDSIQKIWPTCAKYNAALSYICIYHRVCMYIYSYIIYHYGT